MDEVEGVPPAAPEQGAAQAAAAPTGAPRSRRRLMIGVSTAVAATVAVGSAFGLGALAYTAGSASATASTASISVHNTLSRNGFGSGGYGYGNGSSGSSGGPRSGSSSGSSASTGSSALASATAAEEVGVVDITSQLTYAQAESAGTGLVLTSDGEILTNNHVVEDATSISVTVVSTGAQYTAKVVGTDATDDIAVLQLGNASGLSTANLDTSGDAAVGDAVTGVGNAGGAGGTPSASPGTVTALDQTITTQAEQTAVSETLNGLIQTDADIQAGDSGGPVFNSSDQVIGIDTAAAQGGTTTAGYAIPIQSALTIAGEITSGQASSTVTIGYPAFLGVEVASSDSTASGSGYGDGSFGSSGTATGSGAGATLSGVVSGGPAESAGLAAGDTITAVNGTTIDSAQALTGALAALHPGDSATIAWTDASGSPHTAQATLAQGPVA